MGSAEDLALQIAFTQSFKKALGVTPTQIRKDRLQIANMCEVAREDLRISKLASGLSVPALLKLSLQNGYRSPLCRQNATGSVADARLAGMKHTLSVCRYACGHEAD